MSPTYREFSSSCGILLDIDSCLARNLFFVSYSHISRSILLGYSAQFVLSVIITVEIANVIVINTAQRCKLFRSSWAHLDHRESCVLVFSFFLYLLLLESHGV